MTEPLELTYFNWLQAKVLLSRRPSQSYSALLDQLHKTEFVWVVLGDDNRAEDGRGLRFDFARETKSSPPHLFFEEPCSVLEMLVGLARKAEFQTETDSREWFWVFISNLRLSGAYDGSETDPQDVDDILSSFVWRTYDYDGNGGLFPMDDPVEDQRGVELWYQFFEYVEDRHIA